MDNGTIKSMSRNHSRVQVHSQKVLYNKYIFGLLPQTHF